MLCNRVTVRNKDSRVETTYLWGDRRTSSLKLFNPSA
jgi:hypothetical protein